MSCAVDTGSNRSWFETSSGLDAVELHGPPRFPAIQSAAGSERSIAAHELPLEFSIAGVSAIIPRALLISPAQHGGNSPPCALGADAITAMEPVSLDLARMQIDLR
jgi:hypothetical protein